MAPERLATHLGLALTLYCGLIWTAMEAWSGQARERGQLRPAWRPVSVLFVLVVFVQCLLGALVAGNHAGLVDNDWPLMNGWFFPTDYSAGSFWATVAHSQAAVQFNHRMVAYAVVIAAGGRGVPGHAFASCRAAAKELSTVLAGLGACCRPAWGSRP